MKAWLAGVILAAFASAAFAEQLVDEALTSIEV